MMPPHVGLSKALQPRHWNVDRNVDSARRIGAAGSYGPNRYVTRSGEALQHLIACKTGGIVKQAHNRPPLIEPIVPHRAPNSGHAECWSSRRRRRQFRSNGTHASLASVEQIAASCVDRGDQGSRSASSLHAHLPRATTRTSRRAGCLTRDSPQSDPHSRRSITLEPLSVSPYTPANNRPAQHWPDHASRADLAFQCRSRSGADQRHRMLGTAALSK